MKMFNNAHTKRTRNHPISLNVEINNRFAHAEEIYLIYVSFFPSFFRLLFSFFFFCFQFERVPDIRWINIICCGQFSKKELINWKSKIGCHMGRIVKSLRDNMTYVCAGIWSQSTVLSSLLFTGLHKENIFDKKRNGENEKNNSADRSRFLSSHRHEFQFLFACCSLMVEMV